MMKTDFHYVKFEVLMEESIKTMGVWDVAACIRWTGTSLSSRQKVEATCSSKACTPIYKITWRHIPDHNLKNFIKFTGTANMPVGGETV
jgi:hypothetical protein